MLATILSTLSIIAILTLYLTSRSCSRPRPPPEPNMKSITQPQTLRYATPNECRFVIQGVSLPGHGKNKLSQYAARSRENSELQRIFGIDNAFTTDNAKDAKDFVGRARKRIQFLAFEWEDLRRIVNDAARRVADQPGSGDGDGYGEVRIRLTPVVQALSLRADFQVLFDFEGGIEDMHLERLGEVIHRTWMDMKTAQKHIPDFKDNHDLQDRLSAIFKDRGYDVLNPAGNPLNYTLPAFETQWRIVLRMFIALSRRNGDKYEDWKAIMIAFARNPTDEQFKYGVRVRIHGNEDEESTRISANFLVKEALRLYPPTRRIRRAFQFSGSSEYVTAAADVEACQTDPSVWGADASEFNPARWMTLNREQKDSFLAFGGSPFSCPAGSDFGPRVIGLLVGVLLEVFQDGWTLYTDDVEEMDWINSENRLKNEREAYEGVCLVRKTRSG
ncbi:hypothetical protein BJX99DRAFT_254954 [Aspergillus californicus]